MPKTQDASTEAEVPKDAFPVRVNPSLWRVDEVEVDGQTFTHTEPFVFVTESQYDKLAKHKQVGQGGTDEQSEYQLIVKA